MTEIKSLLVLAWIVVLIWFLNAMMHSFDAKPNSQRSVRWRFMFAHAGSTLCWNVALAAFVMAGLPIVRLTIAEGVMSPTGMRVVQALGQSDVGAVITFFLGIVAGSFVVRAVRG